MSMDLQAQIANISAATIAQKNADAAAATAQQNELIAVGNTSIKNRTIVIFILITTAIALYILLRKAKQ